MKNFKKLLQLEGTEYYRKHLEIISSVTPINLTDKEMDVLSQFMGAPSSIIEGDRFNTLVRKLVMKKLKLSSGGLGNYLNSMIKKSVIIKSRTGKLSINPSLMPEGRDQLYQFRLLKVEPQNLDADE